MRFLQVTRIAFFIALFFAIDISFITTKHSFAAESLPPTTTRPLMLLDADRIASLQAARQANSPAWQHCKSNVDRYLTAEPYAKDDAALAMILVYKANGDTTYRDRAIQLLWEEFFGPSATFQYTSRNHFRWGARFGLLSYDWLYNDLSPAQRTEARTAIATWADHWKDYVDTRGILTGASSDSDEVTSLTLGFLMMAIALHGDDPTRAASMAGYADNLMSINVVGTYTDDIMAGGVWTEGTHYSPYTLQFLQLAYLINQESRGIAYPNNYVDLALQAQIHMTSPAGNVMYTYGDIESTPSFYVGILDHNLWDFFSIGQAITDDDSIKDVVSHWLEQAGPPTRFDVFGHWWFLFEAEGGSPSSPLTESWPTRFTTGTDKGPLITFARSSWQDDAIWVGIQNGGWVVDHNHQDALNYTIMRGADYLLREKTGYGLAANQTELHNTIMIENGDDGNSSPTLRPNGEGTMLTDNGTGFDYVTADATNMYNMSGYWAEEPLNLVRRNLLFLHEGWVVVADRVEISDESDCTWTGSGFDRNIKCNPRQKTWLTHFLHNPTESGGIYSDIEGDSKVFWKLLTPGMTTTVIDESAAWTGISEWEIPLNQRTFHLESRLDSDRDIVTVLQLIHVTENNVATMPPSSNLVVTGAEGISFDGKAAIFSTDSQLPEITSAGYTTDATSHFAGDLPPFANIIVTRNGSEIAESPIGSGPAGFVHFSTAAGNAQYTITAGDPTCESNPSLCLDKEACETAGWFWNNDTCSYKDQPPVTQPKGSILHFLNAVMSAKKVQE